MNQIKQIYSWNSITEQQQSSITAKAWNSRTDTTAITVITVITAWNSRTDTTAITAEQQITWNGITVITESQLSQIKQDNSKILFLRYGVISWQNGK